MGFRFRKSKKLLPGVRLNFSKKGVGVRFGGKHGGVSFGPSGTRVSASIPGTGISYSSKIGGKKRKKTAPTAHKRAKPQNTRPVPLRLWYIIVAAFLLIGGIGCLFTDLTAAIFALVVGVGMAAGTVLELRAEIKYIQMQETTELEE